MVTHTVLLSYWWGVLFPAQARGLDSLLLE